MAANKGTVVERVGAIVEPIAKSLGLEVWDIEFVKEGASWFLRIYIDKEDGVTIDDCETLSRAIDAPLDEADPIDQQYYLEVSSPGIERELKRDHHFEAMQGEAIKIRLIRPDLNGKRELTGTLDGYADGVITLTGPDGTVNIRKSETAYVRLSDPEDFI